MGKKSQARAGLDGIEKGSGPKKISKKDRRVAERKTKKGKAKVTPGTKGGKLSELERLRREAQGGAAARQAKREEYKKKGMLYTEDTIKEKEYPEPPHRWNVSVRKMVLYCEITLHKIPTQHISCDMQEERMNVNTLAHSKKMVLDTAYPHGIKVDPNGLAEVSKSGILGIKLRITHLPEECKVAEDEKQKSIAAVRMLRFRKNSAGETVTGIKRKAATSAEEEKAAPEAKKAKKTKVFVTDKDKALELINSVQQQEEPKRAERKTMLDHLTDIKADRKERRMEKRQKKQTMVDHAMNKISRSKKQRKEDQAKKELDAVKPLKTPTGRKVKFAA